MSETTIVSGFGTLQVGFVNPDHSVSYHLIAAFEVSAGKAKPVFWPQPEKGAIEIDEQPGRWSANGLTAKSAGALALMLKEKGQ